MFNSRASTINTLLSGLLLPFRLYFQPHRLYQCISQKYKTRQIIMLSCIALIWIPIMAVFASLVTNLSIQISDILVVPILIGMGILFGIRTYTFGGRSWLGWTFMPLIAFGLVLSIAAIWNSMILRDIALDYNMSVARVVDHPTLDQWATNVLGIAIGISISMFLSHNPQRQVLAVSIIFGVFFVGIMVIASKPDVRESNTMTFGFAAVFLTQIIFQPTYVITSLIIIFLCLIYTYPHCQDHELEKLSSEN